MPSIPLAEVKAAFHRLFIGVEGAALRKEDEQKCLELVGVVSRLASVKKGAHLVDAAAGKSPVGLVAAALLPFGRVTVLERDPARVAACLAAAARSGRKVDVKLADVADASAWPEAPDAVVALHACGGAADAVIDAAIGREARQIFVAPCCYGESVPFRAAAARVVAELGYVADDVLERRMTASLVDLERKLRLEAAGFEADIEEFVAPTVTPHNLLFVGRRTLSDVRMARARERLAKMKA